MRLNNILATLTMTIFGSLVSITAAWAQNDVNAIVENTINSAGNLPGIISVAAYLTGLAMGVKAVLDLMKHVNIGERDMPLKTPIIEFLISGLLLALPFTYEVLIGSLTGGGTIPFTDLTYYAGAGSGSKVYWIGASGAVTEWGSAAVACEMASFNATIGGLFCSTWTHISSLPGLLSAFSYIGGLTLLYLGVVVLKASIENPSQTSLWIPLQRLLVATLLLILPTFLQVIYNTMFLNVSGQSNTDFNLNASTGMTLDMVTANFVFSLYGAMQFVIKGFCYIAGTVLIIIGIFRLMKKMEDGPRGPGGIGTIMTFLTGAALLAIGPAMGAFSTTIFGDNIAETQVCLSLDSGECSLMDMGDYEKRMANFISAAMAYMIVLGWVSFVRGLFIFRKVAEGDQQSSMMSAMTHLIAGSLLVNLGPFLNVILQTLGVTSGIPTITFS